jgi:hypothetical protein
MSEKIPLRELRRIAEILDRRLHQTWEIIVNALLFPSPK